VSTLKKHPFAIKWWMEGIAPAMNLLKKLRLLSVAKEHITIPIMVAELMLWRRGLGKRYQDFFKYVDQHDDSKIKEQFSNMINLGIIITERMPSREQGVSYVMLEDHSRRCTDPDCPIKKMFKVADQVAHNALNLGKGGGTPNSNEEIS
jgi:hypothetical protein